MPIVAFGFCLTMLETDQTLLQRVVQGLRCWGLGRGGMHRSDLTTQGHLAVSARHTKYLTDVSPPQKANASSQGCWAQPVRTPDGKMIFSFANPHLHSLRNKETHLILGVRLQGVYLVP